MVPSVKGDAIVEISISDSFSMDLQVPDNCRATVFIPSKYKEIRIGGDIKEYQVDGDYNTFEVGPGSYSIMAHSN